MSVISLWLTVLTVLSYFVSVFVFLCYNFSPSVLVLRYLVASHAVAVKNANFLILFAGHVVQALVGLHIADLNRIDTENTSSNTIST